MLNSYSVINISFDLSADSRTKIVGQCDVVMQVRFKGKQSKRTIKSVKLASILRLQLLSVINIDNLGVRRSFDKKAVCNIHDTPSIVINLYAYDPRPAHCVMYSTKWYG